MPLLHLQREIDRLNRMILRLGGQVEENLRLGIQCFMDRDGSKGLQLVRDDEQVDSMEVRVEEECLKILALNQPVASDLRYIISLLKINVELERIGDLAAKIGKRTQVLSNHELTALPDQIQVMSGLSRDMVRISLDALIQKDVNRCRQLIKEDKQVDQLDQEVYQWFQQNTAVRPDMLEVYLTIWLTAKDLERIADHACAIAEDVIYLVSGEIVRHNSDSLSND